MRIKAASERQDDLSTLQQLLLHPQASERQRSQIDQEIRMLRAGVRGESETAYELDFHLKDSKNWAVLHDLRLEHGGRVAQIDHLLINRFLDCWVCESKHFSEGVAVNERGEFTAFFNGRPRGVPSPLMQNEKHIEVLKALMNSPSFPLPTRLGLTLRPVFMSLVVVSKGARIQRPQHKDPAFESILKADQVWQRIQRDLDQAGFGGALGSLSKLIGSDTLHELAGRLAQQHRPIRIDWAAKFGLDGLAAAGARATPDRVPAPAVAPAAPPGTPADTAPPRGRSTHALSTPTPPTRAPAPASPAPQTADDPHTGRLSTSRLASKLGLRGGVTETLQRLRAAGYLHPTADGLRDELSPQGRAVGGVLIEKSRFGPYFLWPEDLQL